MTTMQKEQVPKIFSQIVFSWWFTMVESVTNHQLNKFKTSYSVFELSYKWTYNPWTLWMGPINCRYNLCFHGSIWSSVSFLSFKQRNNRTVNRPNSRSTCTSLQSGYWTVRKRAAFRGQMANARVFLAFVPFFFWEFARDKSQQKIRQIVKCWTWKCMTIQVSKHKVSMRFLELPNYSSWKVDG